MWLTCSSIGRKLVMAITGVCLVLFVTFHCLMNSVAIFWPAAYNQICEFLGANWYALIASAGLAVLFLIHIIYATWLTIQNRAARGNDRYAVSSRPAQVAWSSKNMYVLGIVILAFFVVHLIQFWSKMQLAELRHAELSVLPVVEGIPAEPAFGTVLLQQAFSCWITPVVYLIGFIALWFHMNHGFWSMFHTVGWDNNIWISRLKKIGCWWTSIVIVLFIAQAAVFTVRANQKYYTSDAALRAQYTEILGKGAEEILETLQNDQSFMQAYRMQQFAGPAAIAQWAASDEAKEMVNRMRPYAQAAEALGATDFPLGIIKNIVDAADSQNQQEQLIPQDPVTGSFESSEGQDPNADDQAQESNNNN